MQFANANRRDQPRDRKYFEKIFGEISSDGQRTVREETTKDKAGAFPPAVFSKQDSTKVDLLAGLRNDFNCGDQPVGLSSEKRAVKATSEGGNVTDATLLTTVSLK